MMKGQSLLFPAFNANDSVIKTTLNNLFGNKDILMAKVTSQMKKNATVSNIRHFDNKIDMAGLEKITTRINIKPKVILFVVAKGHGIIVLVGCLGVATAV